MKDEPITDDIWLDIIYEHSQEPDCINGVIIDGFPKSPEQTKLLDEYMAKKDKEITNVIKFNVQDDITLARMSGKSNRMYSKRNYESQFKNILKDPLIKYNKRPPPKLPRFMNKYQIDLRLIFTLNTYYETIFPIVEYYHKQNKLIVTKGDRPVDSIWKQIQESID